MTEYGTRPDALSNPRAERVKDIVRLSGRAARLKTGRFVVEGPGAVREALRFGSVHEVFVTEQAADRHPELVASALEAGIPVRWATPEVMALLAGTVAPQGVIAVCPLIGQSLESVIAAGPKLVAVLSQVRDPGNAGTVIRAADAAGADAVILTDSSVDVHNPKCVRSTVGSLFHLPVVTGVGLATAVDALRQAGIGVLAADGSGELDLDDLADIAERVAASGIDTMDVRASARIDRPVAWVFGNEAWGLPEADRALCDAAVRVPIHGHAESLNLAMAATVCLYATARAQRLSDRARSA